jgi:predicted acylesterase/phospholipase RssA
MQKTRKTALVISGGGAKGAFAVGVLKYIFSTYRHTGWFAITGGTSTGGLISPMAALMAALDPIGSQAFETLLQIYTTVDTPDILEKKKIFEVIKHPDALYESDPLNNLLHLHFRPEWFEWLQKRKAPKCYVVYTNYRNGEKVTASPQDKGMTRERFIQAMLASASVPVIMEATIINHDVCFDGGVRDLLPFGKAIDLGAETIVPIFLDPEKFPESQDEFKRMDKVLLRTLDIMKDETLRNDYEMAHLINIGVQAKQEILDTFADDPSALKKLRKVFNKKEFGPLFGSEKRLIKIIKGLRPDKLLTEDSLTFDHIEMSRWVEWGEQKAKGILKVSPFL